jgi:hypothetical protein
MDFPKATDLSNSTVRTALDVIKKEILNASNEGKTYVSITGLYDVTVRLEIEDFLRGYFVKAEAVSNLKIKW